MFCGCYILLFHGKKEHLSTKALFFGTSSLDLLISTRSSAYSISCNTPYFASSITTSITIENKSSGNTEPCYNHSFMKNLSGATKLTLTFVVAPSYKLIKAFTITLGTSLTTPPPPSLKFYQKLSPDLLKHWYSFLSCSYSSSNLLMMNKASMVPLPDMNSDCFSFNSTINCNLFFRTLSTVFIPCSSSFTPQYKMQFKISPFRSYICMLTLDFYSSGKSFSSIALSKFPHHLLSNLTICNYHFNIYFRRSSCLQFSWFNCICNFCMRDSLHWSFHHVSIGPLMLFFFFSFLIFSRCSLQILFLSIADKPNLHLSSLCIECLQRLIFLHRIYNLKDVIGISAKLFNLFFNLIFIALTTIFLHYF